jgi:hypothetical protein
LFDFVFRPMINISLKSDINNIEAIKPNIFGNLVPAMAPDVFLFIKGRLIRGKIFQVNLSMATKKKPDLFSFVPFSSIYIEMDDITVELFQHMVQHLHKSLRVTFGSADQALPSQQWRDPTGQIEPLSMLAGGGDFEPLTFLSPTSSQTGVKAKSGLILKNDGFIILETEQFFLTPRENGWHPWHEPVDKHSWLVSGCNPSNATSIVPVALSNLPQTLSSDESPEWVHPKQLSKGQIPEGVFPDSALIVSSQTMSVELDVLTGFGVSARRFPSDSPRESSLPESCDLDQTKRLSIPDAGPPKPAIRQQFLIQSRPPGFALPGLIAFLGLLQAALYSKLSWFKYKTYFVNVQ